MKILTLSFFEFKPVSKDKVINKCAEALDCLWGLKIRNFASFSTNVCLQTVG